MSYTAHAYRDTAKILKDQVKEILSHPLTQDERIIAVETVNSIAVGLSEIFSKDNPHGFDTERFFTDSGLGKGTFSKLFE